MDEAEAAEVLPAGALVAAWGEPMRVEVGDWLVMPWPALDEVYRIARAVFEDTYRRVED